MPPNLKFFDLFFFMPKNRFFGQLIFMPFFMPYHFEPFDLLEIDQSWEPISPPQQTCFLFTSFNEKLTTQLKTKVRPKVPQACYLNRKKLSNNPSLTIITVCYHVTHGAPATMLFEIDHIAQNYPWRYLIGFSISKAVDQCKRTSLKFGFQKVSLPENWH